MGYTLVQNPQKENPPKENRFAKYRKTKGPWEKYKNQQRPELPEGFVMGPPVAPANRFEKYRAKQTPVDGDPNADASHGAQQSNLAEKVGFNKGRVVTPRKDGGVPFVQGMMLNSADEILPAIAAPLAAAANRLGLAGPDQDFLPDVSENYQQGQALLRAQMARMEAEHPNATLATQIAGGLATGKLPAGFVSRGTGVIGKTARGVGGGAVAGGVAGFNDGTDLESRFDNAQTGATVGGVVGGLAAPVSQLAGKTYQAVANRSGNKQLANELGVKPKVVREISKAYSDDTAQGFSQAADDADLLLNRGQSLQSLAEQVASQKGQGRKLLVKAIDAQSNGAGQRTQDTLNATIGRDAGRVVNANSIEAERKAAGQLFTVARSHEGRFDVQPLAKNIDSMIGETDGGIRAALVKARNLQLFKLGPQGANAVQLHAARLALDDILSKPGLGSNAARMLRDVRGQIDDTLKTNVQGWRQADSAYVAASKKGEALQAGRDVFQRSYGSPQELGNEIRNMPAAARGEFIKGARDSIQETIGTSRNGLSAAKRELLEKGWNRDKLAVLIGKEKAGLIERQLIAETRRAETAQSIAAKSREATASNAAKAFPNANNREDLKSVSLTGLALQGGNWVLNKVTVKRRAELSRQAATLLTRKASEIEPLLQQAAQRVGRRLNVREQIEVVSNALALSSMQASVGQ